MSIFIIIASCLGIVVLMLSVAIISSICDDRDEKDTNKISYSRDRK